MVLLALKVFKVFRAVREISGLLVHLVLMVLQVLKVSRGFKVESVARGLLVFRGAQERRGPRVLMLELWE